jgi:hypothetical protein
VQYTSTQQIWTGGTITVNGSIYTHTFTSNGTLTKI